MLFPNCSVDCLLCSAAYLFILALWMGHYTENFRNRGWQRIQKRSCTGVHFFGDIKEPPNSLVDYFYFVDSTHRIMLWHGNRSAIAKQKHSDKSHATAMEFSLFCYHCSSQPTLSKIMSCRILSGRGYCSGDRYQWPIWSTAENSTLSFYAMEYRWLVSWAVIDELQIVLCNTYELWALSPQNRIPKSQ